MARLVVDYLIQNLMDFENRYDLIKFSRNTFKRIGCGSSREVYRVGCNNDFYALKISRNTIGEKQNENEVEFTEDIGHLGYTANVVSYHPDYLWILSEYASPFEWRGEDWKKSIKISSTLRSEGIADTDHESAWGKIGNRLVVVDFGATESLLEKYY